MLSSLSRARMARVSVGVAVAAALTVPALPVQALGVDGVTTTSSDARPALDAAVAASRAAYADGVASVVVTGDVNSPDEEYSAGVSGSGLFTDAGVVQVGWITEMGRESAVLRDGAGTYRVYTSLEDALSEAFGATATARAIAVDAVEDLGGTMQSLVLIAKTRDLGNVDDIYSFSASPAELLALFMDMGDEVAVTAETTTSGTVFTVTVAGADQGPALVHADADGVITGLEFPEIDAAMRVTAVGAAVQPPASVTDRVDTDVVVGLLAYSKARNQLVSTVALTVNEAKMKAQVKGVEVTKAMLRKLVVKNAGLEPTGLRVTPVKGAIRITAPLPGSAKPFGSLCTLLKPAGERVKIARC